MWRRLFPQRRVDDAQARTHPAGALDRLQMPTAARSLRSLSIADVADELLARLSAGETFQDGRTIGRAAQLQTHLEAALDVHLNRFSRRRLFDVVSPVVSQITLPALRGATVVDLGSGSINPLAVGFVYLALGARRAYAIDLEPAQDEARAVRALATTAAWLFIDPVRIAGPCEISRAAILANLSGFDLAQLAEGYRSGVDAMRLIHRVESLYDLNVPDGEADLVTSVSLLEHVDRVDDALAALYRITKPGGLGHHVVDFVDHRMYGGEVADPLDFLTIDSAEALVHASNRLRCSQVCERFAAHGFVVEHVAPSEQTPVTDADRRRFVEPFRSLPLEDLRIACASIVVRRP